MAYRLERDETISQGVRRIVSEEIEAAVAGLRGGSPANQAIHETRKIVKKIRAILRLLSPGLEREFGTLNATLRSVGHRLSHLRDATVMVETLDSLAEKDPKAFELRGIRAFRNRLVRERSRGEKGTAFHSVLAKSAEELSAVGSRFEKIGIFGDGYSALAPGFKESYRKGRSALKRVEKRPSADRFHDLRKRVKDHWYHARLLEGPATVLFQARAKSLKDLETWLGEDHNLAVIWEKASADPQLRRKPEDLAILLKVITGQQQEYRESALLTANAMYEEKPGKFSRAMRHKWQDWQTGALHHGIHVA